MKKVYTYILYTILLVVIPMTVAFAGTAPRLTILSPEIGKTITSGTQTVIAISLYDQEGDIDESTMKLYLDGKDVTSKANKSVFLVTYTSENLEKVGKHAFSFDVKDREGNESQVNGYFFVVKPVAEKRAFSYNGSIGFGGEYDKQASTSTIGTARLNMYGSVIGSIDYSLNLEFTNEESSDQQRVSTYRLDIGSSIGGFTVGDTTPSFTDYSINGARVFGVDLAPQFGPIGFELVYGQSYKAVDSPETYRQMIYGGKLKIGNRDKFFWGLSLLKVKDDKNSLTNPQNVTPKDNLVLSTDFSLNLFKGVLGLKLEANESMLNEDITAGASNFSDFELPINTKDWEWLFTINEHIVPIMPGLTNLAAKGSVRIGPIYNNTLNFEYSYVGPSYYSLANSGITNDNSGFNIWNTIWLLDRRLYVYGSYQNYRNNLENTLSSTTKSQGFSTNINIYPNDYLTINGGASLLNTSDNVNVDTQNISADAGITRNMDVLGVNSYINFSTNVNLYKDKETTSNDSETYSFRTGLSSYFDNLPLSTSAVVGYDFGTQNSLYLEGWGEYRFLKNESLIASLGMVYESGPNMLDITSGVSANMIYGIKLESNFEYITNTGDLNLSVFASREF